MDVMEAICQRRSVRAYTGQPAAPSSMNEQPWAFAVIQDPRRASEILLWV